ncbi:uncharacterized protein LOC108027119 isoform X2 [Drosophila biarmipes]|uniref:uncharacterized protein LOC108027119 isoform X2 n=1 Tax=Drosophila biarmipes TaxID=125945 RepID=UPI0007E5D4CF|nr:uncharacterized protein LOC108027119 isoform X2 [Drosophila biarmipes]
MENVRPSLFLEEEEKKEKKVERAFSTRYTTTMGIAFGRQTTKFDIPIHDKRALLDRNVRRHSDDKKYVGEFDDTDDARFFTYKPLYDDRDVLPRDPSFAKFKVPTEVSCKERLKKDTIRYNRQLNSEVSKLIDYQSNALEAVYFVSNLEIAETSRNFYKLSKREKTRYDFIMSHDFT